MRNKAKFLSVCSVLSLMLIVPSGYTSAGASHNSCTVNNQNVHWSFSRDGFIGKATIICSGVVNSIVINLDLWFCGSTTPQNDKNWLENNCERVGQNTDPVVENPQAGVKYSRHAPGTDRPGVQRTGWFKAFGTWSVFDTHNGQTELSLYKDFSANAYCRVSERSCS